MEVLAIAKFKFADCILMTDLPNLMLAKVSRYTVTCATTWRSKREGGLFSGEYGAPIVAASVWDDKSMLCSIYICTVIINTIHVCKVYGSRFMCLSVCVSVTTKSATHFVYTLNTSYHRVLYYDFKVFVVWL